MHYEVNVYTVDGDVAESEVWYDPDSARRVYEAYRKENEGKNRVVKLEVRGQVIPFPSKAR